MNIYSFLSSVREKEPLIHHITNQVTIFDCAQVVKSFGASPVMAHAPEEVKDMVSLASALVVNIGTLSEQFMEGAEKAICEANTRGIPVVLDVCGAGATRYRDRKCSRLIEKKGIDIIKGNASEISRVAGYDVKTKGVDSSHVRHDLRAIASELASDKKCTVVITGKQDIICDSRKLILVENGCEMMAKVVGTGCMAASAIGTFAGACPEDHAQAAAAGLCCYEIAAEIAARSSEGPGTFRARLMDCVYALTEEHITSMEKLKKQQPDPA